jgi:hypothetical protein
MRIYEDWEGTNAQATILAWEQAPALRRQSSQTYTEKNVAQNKCSDISQLGHDGLSKGQAGKKNKIFGTK